jgi:iron(III) transport system substrate-binding protein
MKRRLSVFLCLMLASVAVVAGFAQANAADPLAAYGIPKTKARGTGVKLVIYTNSGEEGRSEWLTQRAAQDGFSITVLHGGGSEITERILAESANPICDAVYGLNAILWARLKAANLLVPYKVDWANEVSKGLNDPEGYYYGTAKQAILLVYDKSAFAKGEAPNDWLQLWNDKRYFGKYETQPDLGGGTTRCVIASVLTRYLDPKGELYVSPKGWEQMKLYYEHGVMAPLQNADLYAEMADKNNTIKAGQMWSSGVVEREKMYGIDSGYATPKVGIPYVTEGVGVMGKKSDQTTKEAIRFANWLGSAQIQAEWALKFGGMPANTVAARVADKRQVAMCSIPAQDMKWDIVAKYIDKWVEKIMLEYMP